MRVLSTVYLKLQCHSVINSAINGALSRCPPSDQCFLCCLKKSRLSLIKDLAPSLQTLRCFPESCQKSLKHIIEVVEQTDQTCASGRTTGTIYFDLIHDVNAAIVTLDQEQSFNQVDHSAVCSEGFMYW